MYLELGRVVASLQNQEIFIPGPLKQKALLISSALNLATLKGLEGRLEVLKLN